MYSGGLWAVSIYLHECQQDILPFCFLIKVFVGMKKSTGVPVARCFPANALWWSEMLGHCSQYRQYRKNVKMIQMISQRKSTAIKFVHFFFLADCLHNDVSREINSRETQNIVVFIIISSGQFFHF